MFCTFLFSLGGRRGVLFTWQSCESRAGRAKPGIVVQILERGQAISKRDWKLVRVAVVSLSEQTYKGRLFFGDSEGNVVWDCDCRPSDACWLALKVRLCLNALLLNAMFLSFRLLAAFRSEWAARVAL